MRVDDQSRMQGLEKEIAKLRSSLDKATDLFYTALSVKLQYEEIITGLMANSETGPLVRDAIKEKKPLKLVLHPTDQKTSKLGDGTSTKAKSLKLTIPPRRKSSDIALTPTFNPNLTFSYAVKAKSHEE